MIEDHEHQEGQVFLCPEVADGDGREEGVPVDETLAVEIEELEQPGHLLLGVLLKFGKELFEFVVGKVGVVGVVGVGLRSLLENVLDLIDLDSLPQILQLRNIDRLEVAA